MLYGIQVARGIAAILVVLYHASVWSDVFYDTVFDGFFDFGFIGVDFFFVLSGFIIFYIHNNDRRGLGSWKTYFKKRVIRIYPPFLPISIVLLLVYLNYPDLAQGNRDIGIVSSLFLVPTPYFPALEVSWTLIHEMLFYVFFSIYFFSRRFFSLVAVLWVVLIVTNMNSVSDNYLIDFICNAHNLEFFFGIAAAWAVNRSSRFYKELLTAGFVLIVLFTLAIYMNYSNYFTIGSKFEILYLGIAFSFIVYGICGFDRKLTINYPFSFIFLGSASYSIYLIHYPLVSILNRVASLIYPQTVPHPHLIFFTIVLLCIASGILYHLLYEVKVTTYLKNKILPSC